MGDVLSRRRELAHEAADLVGRLSVEARGGLVEEEEGRFGHEFGCEGEALALFYRETGRWVYAS